MKLEDAAVGIERRPVSACIDLAVLFARGHAPQVLILAAAFGGPACLAVGLAGMNLAGSLLLFFFLSPFLGAALVAASGRRVFGESFSAAAGLRAVGRRLPALIAYTLFSRIAIALFSPCAIIPGLLFATRYGFIAEVLLLEDLRGGRFRHRVVELPAKTFNELAGRLAGIIAFTACAALSIFTLIDISSGVLFGLPVLLGRLPSPLKDPGETLRAAMDLLVSDPTAVLVLTAVLWLLCPIARIAWFLCYLDVRIRKECWDVELDFRVEARRLGAAGAVR